MIPRLKPNSVFSEENSLKAPIEKKFLTAEKMNKDTLKDKVPTVSRSKVIQVQQNWQLEAITQVMRASLGKTDLKMLQDMNIFLTIKLYL